MSGQKPKTGAAPKGTAKAPGYEMVVDETGALVRRPVRTGIVTAAVQASVAPPPPPAANENEVVYNNSGEELTGEAKTKYLAELAAREAAAEAAVVAAVGNPKEKAALAKAQSKVANVLGSPGEFKYTDRERIRGEFAEAAPPPPPPPPPEEDEEDLVVFNNSGEILTGEARARAIAAQAAEAKRQEDEFLAFKDKKPRKSKKALDMESAETDEKIKMFYRFYAKDPQHFGYTAEGNLQVKENPKGIPPMVIPLRAFGPLRPEELEEIESRQREVQETIEQEYVAKLKELRNANDTYVIGDPESTASIVRLNQELRDMSVQRNKSLYPERWSKQLENPDTRKILLNMPYEERKMGYPVYLFKRFSLSRADAEGHYREHGEGSSESMAGGGTVVLFITNPEDPQTGHFHPSSEREFVYNETKYASPYQAYETERFKELGDEKMVEKLLGTRSAKTIKQLVSLEPRHPQHPLQLWEAILESMYTQFKDALENLKATGSARFHMMDKQIGSVEYANALCNVRTKLKEREQDAPGGIDEVKQSVISKEAQMKAKVGGIINTYRHRR